MTTPTTAIEFGPVVKRLGDVTAVTGAGFTVSAGEQVALLGPNGAGKSITVDLLLGLRTPDSGTIRVFGLEPGRAVAEGLVAAMLQRGALPTGARVSEIVDLGCRLYGNARSLADVLELADLTPIAHRRADQLSGGQAQRVRFALARAGRAADALARHGAQLPLAGHAEGTCSHPLGGRRDRHEQRLALTATTEWFQQ